MSERVRILHVEDDPRDAELVSEALLADHLDCDIVRVVTREEYLAALERGNFDLIVCDYTLPSFQGGEALDLAGARWSHIPFLFLSGTIGEERAVEALKKGATEYVLKSNLARLPSAVRRALSEARERADRRKAEEALRASEQRTRALMENAKDAILVANIQGIVVEVNRAAEALYARPRARFVGRHFFELLVADEREKARRHFETVLAGRAPEVQETIALAADGRTVPIEVSASLVEIGGERLVLAIVRDVSERKQLEEQFRQSQKMEAVGRLAGGVAHDFNNLLTVILGYSDVVSNQLPAEHPLRPEVEQIRKAGERAAALTRQLLAFSRTQVLLPQVIDVREIVADIDKMLRRLIGEDVDLVTVCDPQTGRVKADPGQLEQVLMNLAVNARDAMPGGGRLTIETRNVQLRRGRRPGARHGAARIVRGDRGQRHGIGDGRGDEDPHLRAVLHDEGEGKGDRPRPRDRVRDRETERRLRLGLERAGPGDHVQDLPAARRGGRGLSRRPFPGAEIARGTEGPARGRGGTPRPPVRQLLTHTAAAAIRRERPHERAARSLQPREHPRHRRRRTDPESDRASAASDGTPPG